MKEYEASWQEQLPIYTEETEEIEKYEEIEEQNDYTEVVEERHTEKSKTELPPLIMFTGPDTKNHRSTETQLIHYLSTAQKKVLVCTYTIGNGVLSIDLAKRLKRVCKDNFKIITDQMQMTNANLKRYSNNLLDLEIPIK